MSSQKGDGGPNLVSIDHDFWQSLQVYPGAIGHDETRGAYQKRAHEVLSSLPLSNVRYVCDRLGVAYAETEDLPQPLAFRLMNSEHSPLLTCLSEYLKRHINHVVDYFDKKLPASFVQNVVSEIASKSKGGYDTPKPFTKLLAIYLNRRDDLALIHYTYNWRRIPTVEEFDFNGGVPPGARERLIGEMDALLKSLGGLKEGEEYSYFGTSTVRPGLDVFVLHRNYRTTVRPDYRERYRLQHDYGQVIFGLSTERNVLVVKVGNRNIREVITAWIRRSLDADLSLTGITIFRDYASDRVARDIMGDYDESYGLDSVGIGFRHSTLPGGSPLTITATEFSRSIREELFWLREKGILRITALSDISAMMLRYEGVPAKVEVQTHKGGAVSFRLVDQNLDEDYTEGFKAAFLDVFHLPIGQIIDPSMMRMGAADIYQHLLSGIEEHQVRGYQREQLKKLLDLGLLKAVTRKVGSCTHATCASNTNQFTDETLIDCPSCQTRLKWEEHKRYKLNAKAIAKAAKPILQNATGRSLSSTPHRFESHPVHRLSSKKRPGKFIHVFFNERLRPEKMDVFRRSLFPMLIVHPTGAPRAPVVDGDGIAHMGLGHALAASDDPTAEKEFRDACRATVRRLMQMEQERVLRAARHSRDSLAGKVGDYNDRMFESDVFNLMRRLFPYSIKMGGANKPDGFSSLVYFGSGHLREPNKVNLSYDAKYSAKGEGYDFGIGEHRQIHEYIKSLNRSKQFQREGHAYDGHIIIYNNIKEASLANAANYLSNIDRLPKSRERFLLVFLHESFLIKAWDLLQDNSAELMRRWYAFPEAFHVAIQEHLVDGYTLLNDETAREIVANVLRERPSDDPIDHDSLLVDIKRFVGQRTNRTSKKDVAAKN